MKARFVLAVIGTREHSDKEQQCEKNARNQEREIAAGRSELDKKENLMRSRQ